MMTNEEIYKLEHVGVNVNRATLFNHKEKIFAENWKVWNDIKQNTSEHPVIQHILSHDDECDKTVPDISQRDVVVAATVIQWLGSNVGQEFLIECLADIKHMNKSIESAGELVKKIEKALE